MTQTCDSDVDCPPAASSDETSVERAAWTRGVEPLFLVGSPRSGTTWLQSLLAAHPEVHTGPETHFFAGFQPVQNAFWASRRRRSGLSAYLRRDAFYSLIAEAFWKTVSCLPPPADTPRYFLEKSPQHCRASEFILNTFPGARFIHLVRDPRAVVASLLRVSSTWAWRWAPADVTTAARIWNENVEVSRRIAATVEDTQFVEVRYEDLRADPTARLAQLWSWLGLEFPAGMVEEAVRANELQSVRGSAWPFPGIARLSPESLPDPEVGYPGDFVGPAPTRAEEIGLPVEVRARVEEMTRRLLLHYGYCPAPPDAPGLPPPADADPGAERTFGASVIVVGRGDDPTEILETLTAMSDDWRDEWELVLTPQSGSACRTAAEALSGDFQLLAQPEPCEFGEALRKGALAARARYLIVPTERGLFWIPQEAVAELGGARGVDRERILAWLQWRGEERPDLLPTRLAEARAASQRNGA